MQPNQSIPYLSNHSIRLDYKLPYHAQIHRKVLGFLRYIHVHVLVHRPNMNDRSLTIDPILAIHQDKVEKLDDYQIDFLKKGTLK